MECNILLINVLWAHSRPGHVVKHSIHWEVSFQGIDMYLVLSGLADVLVEESWRMHRMWWEHLCVFWVWPMIWGERDAIRGLPVEPWQLSSSVETFQECKSAVYVYVCHSMCYVLHTIRAVTPLYLHTTQHDRTNIVSERSHFNQRFLGKVPVCLPPNSWVWLCLIDSFS